MSRAAATRAKQHNRLDDGATKGSRSPAYRPVLATLRKSTRQPPHGCDAAAGSAAAASAGQLCVARGGEGAICGWPTRAPAHRLPRRARRRLCRRAAVPGTHGAATVRLPLHAAHTPRAALTHSLQRPVPSSALPGTSHALLGMCPAPRTCQPLRTCVSLPYTDVSAANPLLRPAVTVDLLALLWFTRALSRVYLAFTSRVSPYTGCGTALPRSHGTLTHCFSGTGRGRRPGPHGAPPTQAAQPARATQLHGQAAAADAVAGEGGRWGPAQAAGASPCLAAQRNRVR